jgi:very-short-patch-repair endonuclease
VTPGRQDLTSAPTWRVNLDECLRGVVRYCDRETAIACLDTAITLYKLDEYQIRSMFRHEPAESRSRAAAAKPGSDSGTESLSRQRFEALGLVVRQQVTLPEVGDVDMRIGRTLVVEVDGWAYHSDRAAFENDRRRDALIAAQRLVPLRFSYKQVMTDWPFVERIVLACLKNEGDADPS